MKYWPLSQIVPYVSPLLAPELRDVQVRHIDNRISYEAVAECGHIAMHLPATEMPRLSVIETTDALPRRFFTGFPSFEEWAALERTGIVADKGGVFYLLLDALH